MSLQLIITTAVTTCLLLVGLGLAVAGITEDYVTCQDKSGGVGCSSHRPQIWSLILQAVVGIGALVAIFTNCAAKVHSSVVGFLVLAGVFMLQHAQEVGRGEDDFYFVPQILASVGFLVLFLWNCGMVIYLGVTRAAGNAFGMRRKVECTIVGYALFLKFGFAVLLGGFMVGASIVGEGSDCGSGQGMMCKLGLKWGAIAFVVLVMGIWAVCSLVGVAEGYETTLGAIVALAASVVMDLASDAFPTKNTHGAVEAAGFIILSAACLFGLIVLGMGSKRKEEEEEVPWLKAVEAAFWYSLLPLLFGWALSVVGVAKFASCKDCAEFPGLNLTYWTLVFEMVSIILAGVGKQRCLQNPWLKQLRMPSILFIVLATVNIMRLIEGCMVVNQLWLSMAAAGLMLVATMNCVVTVLLGLEAESPHAGFTPLIA